jgi:hypothetical protein
MDVLQCEALMVVCKTLVRGQQNVSVFAGNLPVQEEQLHSISFSPVHS